MGDTEGLDPHAWLDRHGGYLFRYAMAVLRDRQLAEDAVQECLLAALQARTGFSGQSSERTWLTGILKHKIVDIVRRDSRESSTEGLGDAEDPYGEFNACFDATGHWAARLTEWGDPERHLESKQFWRALQFCLDNMPRRLAQLFMLREVVGTDSAAICQEMGISPTNLWTQLYRGRMSLRLCLEKHWLGREAPAC
ncbi:MAG: sigma-70 family RNA polymerase sigma factor [Thiobacillaceae bacterium]|jgi:RNA polymerase sigma-70 factor (ECF subfamily)|nr:sigma-70 family RNA polymerase sigma factor [Thiobacillaceae bacterium]